MAELLAAILAVGAIVYTVYVREDDLPPPEPVNPVQHLEERKQEIYESLRDLNFEYRMGKLSDEDYQRTKLELQRELAAVLAEIDRLQASRKPTTQPKPASGQFKAQPPRVATVACPHCGAQFPMAMKFCGECGKPLHPENA